MLIWGLRGTSAIGEKGGVELVGLVVQEVLGFGATGLGGHTRCLRGSGSPLSNRRARGGQQRVVVDGRWGTNIRGVLPIGGE